jgi:hypothetical protein
MKSKNRIPALSFAMLLTLTTMQASANSLAGLDSPTNYFCGFSPGLCIMPDDPIWYIV